MNERKHETNEKYQRVRSDFDELDAEEKVVFILEATVSTVARGIDAFGRAVSDEINNAFSRRAENKSRRGSQANGEPSTAGGEAPSAENTDGGPDEKSEETP